MKTNEYKDFRMPMPVKGQMVDVEIVDAEEVHGTKPDANGVCSTGLKLVFNIAGPPEVVMDNGDSAVGFGFKQIFWEPRASADAKWAARQKRDFGRMLKGAFGTEIPEDVQPPEWIGRHLIAILGTEYDSFEGEDVAKITKVITPDDLH